MSRKPRSTEPTPITKMKHGATKTIGGGGTAFTGGYVVSEEKDSSLSSIQERHRLFSNMMLNTSIVAAGVRYYLDLASKAKWKVEAADESDKALEIKEKVEKIMASMDVPWYRVVRRAAMYRFYGFSIQEWTAKKLKDGLIGFVDIQSRPQKTICRWEINETTGHVDGMYQSLINTNAEVFLPREKVVYIVDDSLSDSPEGVGLLRHLVKNCEKLTRYEILEAWGFETDLRGVPVGRAPIGELNALVADGTLTQTEMDTILLPIKNFIENHIRGPKLGMLLDSTVYHTADEANRPSSVYQWDLDLMTSRSNSLEPLARAIERINRELARILGVEHLMLGDASSGGSNAMSKDKNSAFALMVDSALIEIAWTFNQDILGTLQKLNGWDEELMPKFKTEALQFRDIDQIMTALARLAQAGVPITLNDPVVNEIRDLLGLTHAPEVDEEEVMNALMASMQAKSNAPGAAPNSTGGGMPDPNKTTGSEKPRAEKPRNTPKANPKRTK